MANRLYGWRYNPLYQSGTLAVLAFLVMLVTGLYLLLFYRIGSPYESVARMEGQLWAGRWIRALHRYAADLAILALAVHALRMFVQSRSFGPRTLAWVSGLVLAFGFFVCGWTGYVMLWDEQALVLAVEGARLLDALPIFSEPLVRTFVGERPIPSAFFFLNLFLHIALPVGLALLLWIHVARLARPVLLPPRGLLWGSVAALFVVSLVLPAPLGPEADPLLLPARVDLDLFYSFWLPASRELALPTVWGLFLAFSGALLLVPLWTRPARAERPAPSRSNERLCTGCLQCSLDCPYEAISMLPLGGDPARPVARVDAGLCVSCGICTGSCAPMAIGPAGETGRDELAAVRAFAAECSLGPGDLILVACRRGAGRVADQPTADGFVVFPVTCAGHLHTSVLEFLLRSGAGGVLVASCPPRDCWSREGPTWLDQRLYHGREAELRESLDRRRLAVVHAAEGELHRVRSALAELRDQIAALGPAEAEDRVELEAECETSMEAS